jgi:ABC-2 type transport system ATP-binding protein
LFVDEPTAGLDPMLRQKIWAEFHRLRDRGRTLVVTTQVVSEAAYCDAVAVLSEGRLIALAPPDELLRMASGGDIVQITTADAFDGVLLEELQGVREIRQRTPREIRVISDDAATTLPRVVEAIQSAGGSVESSSEYRPTFDEVFSTLVRRADGAAADHEPGEAPETEQHERATSRAA